MPPALLIASVVLLLPLAVAVTYTDVRFRRIPNAYAAAALAGGLLLNTFFGGFEGLTRSLAGCALAFVLMLVLHLVGGMGAGDVKLFAAVGAVVGLRLVLPAFVLVMLVGFAMAVFEMVRVGAVRQTLRRVLHIFGGAIPLVQAYMPAAPAGRRRTIPYGVAIVVGGLASLFLFRA
jgi:prepilin peptidase CpaA